MRIAMLAPIWESVPPPAYGGIELVVGSLVEGLTERGHDVTLFATGDSVTRARLVATEPQSLRRQGVGWNECQPREMVHVAACFHQAHAFDVIHNHVGYLGMMVADFTSVPVVTTLHGAFNDHNLPLFRLYQHLPYVSISRAQREGGPEAMNYVATVYNGIETSTFAITEKGGYLLNLGRVSPEKGTHLAIEAALRAGRPLIIAGKIDPVDQQYYETQVQPHLDDDRVQFIGEVGGQAKLDLLAGADALLHPVQWPEPFGLVMAEALASGTPVIAFPLGSIPEVVTHGETGFVVDSVAAMAEAIGRLGEIEPARCRAHAIARFDAARMTQDYMAVYEQVLEQPVTITRTRGTRV